ncbi:MAG: hypothetical protein M0009_13190 [Deltaproteobacteria bacterium]|nr:hypothetical protein [Deltaproteobacteria bacterium]
MGKFAFILSCLLAFNACEGLAQKKEGAAGGDPATSGIVSEAYRDLLAKAQATGAVRIIVRLNMPFVADGLLSKEAALEQQGQISRLQDQLGAALAGYKVQGIKRSKYTPFIAMEVDAAALRALISNSLVLSIAEDAPAPPTGH